MKHNVKITGIELSPALAQHIESAVWRIGRFADKNDEGAMAQIEIGRISDHHRSGAIYKAEFTVRLSHLNSLHAGENDFDIFTAVNLARKEIVRQIKTARKKQKTMEKRGGRRLKDALRGLDFRRFRRRR
ncbi:MAG: ribosome-associated translation inhibitor RaiA [Candidatus Paceibacterota bacterium]